MASRVGAPLLVLMARKGGVGKSMLATVLARIYAKSGLRVLLADLDPQSTSTEVLVPEKRPDPAEFGECLSRGQSLLHLICGSAVERLSLVPASERLSVYETALAGDPMGVAKVKNALASLRGWECDLVVVDTPPTIGAFTFGALAAGTWALIPTYCEDPCIRTLPSAVATVAEARAMNPDLGILAVVANRLDRRTRHGLSALETLRAAFPTQLASTVIPAAAAVGDCMRAGCVIDEHAQASSVLVELAEELLGRMTSQARSGAESEVNEALDCTAVHAVESDKEVVAVNE